MIQLIGKTLMLFGIMAGLCLMMVYAPDYLNVPSVADRIAPPTFLSLDGVEVYQPQTIAQEQLVIVMYWSVQCTACAEQRENLRAYFADSPYADRIGLVYVNAWEDQAAVQAYVDALPVTELPEYWLTTDIAPPGAETIPYCLVYVNGEEALTWNGRQTVAELKQTFEGGN